MTATALDTQPTTLDIRAYNGDTFTAQFTFTDQATGNPYPLTGTWQAQIRTPADTVVTEFAVDTTLAATGILRLTLTGTQTALLAGTNRLVWDLQQTTTAVRTWYAGSFWTRP